MLSRTIVGMPTRLVWFQALILVFVLPCLSGCTGGASAPSQSTASVGSNVGSNTGSGASTGSGGNLENGISTTSLPPMTLNQTIIAVPGHAFTNAATSLSWQSAVHSGTYRKSYLCTSSCASIKCLFGNQFLSDSFPNAPVLPTITITATLENPAKKTLTKLTFAGKSSATISPDQLLYSDPVSFTLNKGDLFYVRTFVSGQLWPTGPLLISTAPFLEGFTPNQDLTNSHLQLNSVPDLTAGYAPMAVVAVSTLIQRTPNIAIVGDSIASGFGDTIARGTNTQADMGYIVRALAKGGVPGLHDQYGYMRISAYGELAAQFVSVRGYSLRLRLVQGCTYAICDYGANDVIAGNSVLQIEQDMLQVWRLLAQNGIKVYQTTLTPFTKSTDNWTSVSGQTVPDANREVVRVAINNWFRDSSAAGGMARSGGNLKGIFEIADLAETRRDSGRWKPGYTEDGLHPNGVGAQALAAGINTAVFQ